ncbi:MAG: TRAP transporter small permease [Deltaproteobacteria bacterium]|nr:TRAP transporter small permease [Deltaproteobacteria bacterium]
MQLFIKIFNAIEEYALGMTLLILAIYSCIQVVTRYALNYSFTSYEEVARYSCIFITFLGASLGIKYGAHFAMTAVIERFPFRLRELATAFVWLVSALFFFVVTYFGIIQCLKLIKFDLTTPALRIPMYLPFLPIPVFSAVMGCRSLLKVRNAFMRMIRGNAAIEPSEENDGERTA